VVVGLVLLAWQLLARRNEALAPELPQPRALQEAMR
jgi:hypothetical protein